MGIYRDFLILIIQSPRPVMVILYHSANRFAIEYHRSIRSKEQVRSVLDEIPGVGPARRKALMKCFDSIEEIKQANAQELHEKAGIPLSTAEEIYSFFHGSVVE